MVVSKVDTSLDARGLRIVDPNGHRLYWHVTEPIGEGFARAGRRGGICTEGEVWDQDQALSRHARASRLHLAGVNTSWLTSGTGHIKIELTYVPGEPPRTRVVVLCRGRHLFDAQWMPPFNDEGNIPTRWVQQVLIPLLRQANWIGDNRIECPEHRVEREQVERALAELRAAGPPAPLQPLTGGAQPAPTATNGAVSAPATAPASEPLRTS